MDVQATNYNYANYPAPANNTPAAPTAPTAPTQPSAPAGGPNLNAVQLNQLNTQQNFLQLFERTFSDQLGVANRINAGQSLQDIIGGAHELTPEEAYAMIGEDGFFGVERTAQRLFDMAYSLSGGDDAMMERMREAVLAGFDAAERQWGSELPQISQDTRTRTMEMFEAFANRNVEA